MTSDLGSARRPGGILAVVVGAASVAPFAYLAGLSIAGRWPWPGLWPDDLRFDRWRSLWAGGGALAEALSTSLLVSVVVAAASTAAGYVTARAVAKHRRRALLLSMAFLPFAVSPVVLGACLLFFYLRVGLAATLHGLLLAHGIVAYGFAVVFFVPFWNAEKRALSELVATLGGGAAQTFVRVLLPLSRGPLLVCFLQTFLLSWFQYGLTLLVGEGRYVTLPVLVYAYLNEANPGYAATAALLLALPAAALAWVSRNLLKRDTRGAS